MEKLYCNTGNCIAVRHLGWAGSVLQYTGLYCREEGWNCIARKFCIAIEGDGSREQCIAIHCTVLWLEGLQKARLYRNTTWSIVAGDRVACVARQADVSRHGADVWC